MSSGKIDTTAEEVNQQRNDEKSRRGDRVRMVAAHQQHLITTATNNNIEVIENVTAKKAHVGGGWICKRCKLATKPGRSSVASSKL
jgi:hypothetical protein